MDKTLKLVGQSSNEIYVLRYPSALLDFCDYDLSYFAKRAVEACSEAQKTGEIDFDRFAELRRDIRTAHCYIEHHIRTKFEKIPIDCYIDFLCRRDNVGTGTLWNRFISCRTPFEKAVFQRLCEFRYNRAINEWLNILRVRDYAQSKIEFVFPAGIKSAEDAAARRNYFDLMFSVTASEMGCRLDKLGETKVFSIGRIPNSPFMFPAISKDIIRNVLADFDYSDDYSDIKDYGEVSDEIAMDAFSRMKNGLAAELSSYNILRSKMEKYDKIYMPCSFKAVIDLEIDAIIESGGYLAICPKCKKRYYRGKDYDEDYCNYLRNGKSCLDEYLEENPPKRMTPELEEKSRAVTNEVYSRVGNTMSTKEYESWYSYMTAMKDKVGSGEISPEEFADFLDYSLTVDISKSKPILEVPKPSGEHVIKPFVPERIERSAIKQPVSEAEPEEPSLPDFPPPPAQQPAKDGFFVSPSVARRTSERRISHIIRAGEPRGENNYDARPNPADFRPFTFEGQSPKQPGRIDNENPDRTVFSAESPDLGAAPRAAENLRVGDNSRVGENSRVGDNPRAGENTREKETLYESARENTVESIENRLLAELEALRERTEQKQSAPPEKTEQEFKPLFAQPEEPPAREEIPVREENPVREAPRKRVIRKNAAAISAYGKMSGAPVISAPPELDIVSRFEQPESRPIAKDASPAEENSDFAPDAEPFKNINSIFDVLENSAPTPQASMTDKGAPQTSTHQTPTSVSAEKRRRASGYSEEEPSPEWEEDEKPDVSESDFGGETPRSELDILKEKKQHAKSNKTKRLYDVIMREPDDNPNVRRKK